MLYLTSKVSTLSRNTYILVITLLFSLVYIPHLINTILFSILKTDPINFSIIPKADIKMVLLVLICFMESTLIKKQYPGILGWILSVVLLIAITMRGLRWPYATEIMVISTVLLLSVLILFAIKEKNKRILNHMLMAYVAIRVLMLLFRPIDFLWILELIIGCSVVILGIRDSIKISKALFYTK